MSLIYEIDLYNQWFPFVKESSVIKDLDKATRIGYLLLDIPMISPRE